MTWALWGPLCSGTGSPWVHTQGTHLTLTPGAAWASSALWPEDTCLRPGPSPPGSWSPCKRNGGRTSGVGCATALGPSVLAGGVGRTL